MVTKIWKIGTKNGHQHRSNVRHHCLQLFTSNISMFSHGAALLWHFHGFHFPFLLQPILAIRLELVSSEITFIPPLSKSSAALSLQEYVDMWLNDYLLRARNIASVHQNEVCLSFTVWSIQSKRIWYKESWNELCTNTDGLIFCAGISFFRVVHKRSAFCPFLSNM